MVIVSDKCLVSILSGSLPQTNGVKCSSVVRAFAHGVMGVGLILNGYFSFQPVHHYWCNKDHGMCYPVCGMVHIK